MAFNLFYNLRPGKQLLLTGFVVLVSFFIIQLLSMLLAIPFFGLSTVSTMITGLSFTDPGTIRMLKYFQVFQSIGLFILPSMLIAWMFHPRWISYLQLDVRPSLGSSFWVFILVIVINPFINFTGALNSEMHFPDWLEGVETWMRNAEDAAESLIRSFLKVDSVWGLLFNLFMIAVLPGLGEELLFRGVIQKIFTRLTRNVHLGIWLSAALFSALHMQFYGFIPRMLLGGMFGYLLVWSGTLWLPVLAHFINNAGAVILLYMIDKGQVNPAIEDFGKGQEGWLYALFSLIMGLIILLVVRQRSPETLGKNQLPSSVPTDDMPENPADVRD